MSILSWLYTIVTRLKRLEKKIDQIIDLLTAPFITFELEGEPIDMLEMTDSQQATVTLKINDSRGKPAKVDGIPTWKIDDDTIATVTPSADGMTALCVAGNAGAATITVDADADLGPGITDITGVLSVVVTSGPATVIELQAGTPVEQPA